MMGMEIFGTNPNNPCGKYFGITAWGWHPLATYVREVAPEIAAKCKHWYSNDFDGLNGEDSLLLADLLQKEIDSGRTEKYARLRRSQFKLAPNEPCWICAGTGTRKPAPERGAGNPTKDGIVCRSCYGQGYIPPSPADYDFPVEILQDFVHFLRYCGGFEIW
jgi:hypothetical protein